MKNFKTYIKMVEKIVEFDDTEIEKYKFRQYKGPNSIDNLNIDKIVVSDNISSGKNDFKYFIGYKDTKIN